MQRWPARRQPTTARASRFHSARESWQRRFPASGGRTALASRRWLQRLQVSALLFWARCSHFQLLLSEQSLPPPAESAAGSVPTPSAPEPVTASPVSPAKRGDERQPMLSASRA